MVVLSHRLLLLHVRKDLAAHLVTLALLAEPDIILSHAHVHLSLLLGCGVGPHAVIHVSLLHTLGLVGISSFGLLHFSLFDLVEGSRLLVELLRKLALLVLRAKDLHPALVANHLQRGKAKGLR